MKPRAQRYVCVHGHFYQPPRENAWLEEIELQDSAYPYHDWNERIAAECYAPNAAARILDDKGRITRIVNNYARISFNFGPTLLAWLQRNAPETYGAILEADRSSRERFSGHGSAWAQVYNHPILPLCNVRDKRTQVLWGLHDFRHRFGRAAEGMWLPETAVDLDSLETLAEHGIRFTVLAPSQAGSWRADGDPRWIDVADEPIDTSRAYRVKLPSGRTIDLLFYDGAIARAVAFERLLSSGDRLVRSLTGGFRADDADQLVHFATDGETYGHHHRFGDMALAYALERIESEGLAQITNYGEFLSRHPPRHEVRIREATAWSCAHGLGRWREDCGCSSGTQPDWHQRWRAPLRDALDRLRDRLAVRFERIGARLFRDPWEARDRYIELVIDRSAESRDRFFAAHGRGELSEAERATGLELLELQRHSMLMYTSCGWFFDEVSGIETVQILQYAARAAQLGEKLFGESFEAEWVAELERVPSNRPELGDARHVYNARVAPAKVDLARLAANLVAGSLFEDPRPLGTTAFAVEERERERIEVGRSRLALGRLVIRSRITCERDELVYGFLHLGDHTLNGSVGRAGDASVQAMIDRVREPFAGGDIPTTLQRLEEQIGPVDHSLRTLFRDQQRRILRQVLDSSVREIESVFGRLYAQYSSLTRFVHSLEAPLPRALRATVEVVLNHRLRQALEAPEPDAKELGRLLDETERVGAPLDGAGLALAAERALERQLAAPGTLPRAVDVAEVVSRLPFRVNLARAQTLFYRLVAETPESQLPTTDSLLRLGELLNVAPPGR